MTTNKQNLNILKSCLANPQTLTSLIEYSPDAVVSKTIIDKPAGTVTLFAFDKDQKLSEHTTPYDAIVQIIDGNAQLTIDGKNIQTSTGQIIIMPANVPHAVTATEKFKMMLIMVRELKE